MRHWTNFNLVILIVLQLIVIENMSQSIELEEIEVKLDDTLTVNPTPRSVEFGTTKDTPD